MKPALVLTLLCAACSHVSYTGVARLAALSPETADPAGLEIALMLPDGLRVPPGTARLSFAARRTDTGAVVAGDYVLERHSQTAEGAGLWRIAPADLPRLRVAQAQVSAWKSEAGSETKGSLSVGLGGCATGQGPAPDAVASILIRTEAEGAFVPLLTDAPVAAILERSGHDSIDPCDQ